MLHCTSTIGTRPSGLYREVVPGYKWSGRLHCTSTIGTRPSGLYREVVPGYTHTELLYTHTVCCHGSLELNTRIGKEKVEISRKWNFNRKGIMSWCDWPKINKLFIVYTVCLHFRTYYEPISSICFNSNKMTSLRTPPITSRHFQFWKQFPKFTQEFACETT